MFWRVRRAFGRAPASRAAKAEGKYKGRVPTAQRKAAEVVQLRGQGVKPEAIAEKLGISRASVFRVLREQRTPGRLSEG